MKGKKFGEILDEYLAKNPTKKRTGGTEPGAIVPPLAAAAPPPVKKKKEAESLTISRLPIRSLQEYSLDAKDQRDVIFIRRLEETGRLGDTYLRELPPMREVLAYIERLPQQPLWYRASQDSIINSRSLTFPDMDVLTRDYIRDFLRVPSKKGELPCSNPACESERLGKFRIRQLLLTKGVSTWCFLCHLFYTNKLYFESLNRKTDKAVVYQIHQFMVMVDVEGEYRLDRTLTGDSKDVRGIYGPFPLYNCYNYVPTPDRKAWIESDTMVFRLPQTV